LLLILCIFKHIYLPQAEIFMSNPFISICIPTYKRAGLFKKLLESIMIQTYRDTEILVNDNSPDDSIEAVVKEYKGILTISYVRNGPALSAVDNCRVVMRRAKGDWIKIIHDDDWFATPDALQQFADAAVQSGKDFIFCASNQVYLESGKIEEEYLTPPKKAMLEDSVLSLFYENVIGHPSVVMHKKDASIEYDPQFNWVLDIDFYLRYITAHGGYHYIDETLVNIGKNELQESNKYYKKPLVEIPEYFTLLAKYEPGLHLRNIYVFHLVWNMLKRFKIKNAAQVNEVGYNGRMPEKMEAIIAYQLQIPHLVIKQTNWSRYFMSRCFKKLSR
jgi:glycosyltransferase involved in cell wall biosynthesis